MHGLQSFVLTHPEKKSDSVLFILCLQYASNTFSKENSAISLEEWVLVFKVLTTATRKLRVKIQETFFFFFFF